jgi:hypothetical protein
MTESHFLPSKEDASTTDLGVRGLGVALSSLSAETRDESKLHGREGGRSTTT